MTDHPERRLTGAPRLLRIALGVALFARSLSRRLRRTGLRAPARRLQLPYRKHPQLTGAAGPCGTGATRTLADVEKAIGGGDVV